MENPNKMDGEKWKTLLKLMVYNGKPYQNGWFIMENPIKIDGL